jgi:hypothetical protein
MSLSKLWKWYEKLVLSYCDVENSIKITIANLLTMSLFVIFNYLFYYLLLGFRNEYDYIILLVLAFGKGRLLLFFILNKNNIKKKGENLFVFILAYLTVGSGVVGIIHLIFKDINGGFPKKEPQSYTKEVNPNLLNNSNKYDYLKVK